LHSFDGSGEYRVSIYDNSVDDYASQRNIY
jgi:hypothetical protein